MSTNASTNFSAITAGEFINELIPTLRFSDHSDTALGLMEELQLNQLPIVQGIDYQGLISYEILRNANLNTLQDWNFELEKAYIYENQHFYEMLKVAKEHKTQVIAVLDEAKKYLGAVNVKEATFEYAKNFTSSLEGAVLVVQTTYRNYSLAEISRLIEAENVKILTVGLDTNPAETDKVRITLKLNSTQIGRVISALERFEYHIVGTFQNIKETSLEMERLGGLLKYLSI